MRMPKKKLVIDFFSLFPQLIQFLITLARSNRVLGVKRKMQVNLRLTHISALIACYLTVVWYSI